MNDHTRFRFITFLVLIVATVAAFTCTGETGEPLPEHIAKLGNLTVLSTSEEPLGDIELIYERSFGDTDDVILGSTIRNIDVDHDDRVYIADVQQHTIHVYDSDGSYLRNIGREGNGPGEFQRIQDLTIDDEHVHVLDSELFKVSAFDLNTFQLSTSYDLSFGSGGNDNPSWLDWTREKGMFYRPNHIFVRPNGSYLVLFSDSGVGYVDNVEERTFEASIFSPDYERFVAHDLLSFRWTGQVLTHEEDDRRIVMFQVPYKRSSTFDFADETFVVGWTEEMLFEFYDQDGAYQRAIYYPHSNVPLQLEDVLSYYEDAGEPPIRAVRNDELPDTWPAFDSLKLDDENRLWVATHTGDPRKLEWWVMNSSGELLATFDWPRNRNLQQVKNGYAYTIENDEQIGVLEVVRYRIDIDL